MTHRKDLKKMVQRNNLTGISTSYVYKVHTSWSVLLEDPIYINVSAHILSISTCTRYFAPSIHVSICRVVRKVKKLKALLY